MIAEANKEESVWRHWKPEGFMDQGGYFYNHSLPEN
jgi:hypothetical protein